MAFEDPLKLKIDLVVEPESSNLDPTADSAASDPLDRAAVVSTGAPSPDASLTPWKNRFANHTAKGSTPKLLQHRIASIAFGIVDHGVVGLSVITAAISLFVLSFARYGSDPIQNSIANWALYLPIALGFALYPLFVVRLLLTINSLRQRKQYLPLLRSVAPAIIANTMTTWGLMLALFAVLVAKLFSLVKSLEPSITHQQMGTAMAGFALAAAGSLQVFLILLLIASMVLYKKLFEWIAKRTSEVCGEKKAGLTGVIVGAIFGLCGLYTALSAGGVHQMHSFAISTSIWSIGILIASRFFSQMRKLAKTKH